MKPLDAEQGTALAKLQSVAFASGRAEEREAIARYLRVWADFVRDNEAIDGRFQALVTDMHANNITRGEHITRPDPGEGQAVICNSHRREHPQDPYEDCPHCAAEEDRAAIVAWLRAGAATIGLCGDVRDEIDDYSLIDIADAIERGEWRK